MKYLSKKSGLRTCISGFSLLTGTFVLLRLYRPHTIRRLAIARIDWIKKQRQEFANQRRQIERRYVPGESCCLWGRRYRLDVVYSNTNNGVSVSGQKIILKVRQDSSPQQRADVMASWYRETLKKAIPSVSQKCERLVGIQAAEWKIKNMRTKWGTCNISKKRIWLNLQLAKKTPECLEYVIIHELVHLLERNHNDVFKAYMDRYCPNWRTVKATLNERIPDYAKEQGLS